MAINHCLIHNLRKFNFSSAWMLENIFKYKCQRRFFHCTSRSFSPCLTKDKLIELKRGPFSYINDDDCKFFEMLLDKSQIISDADDLEIHNTDWMHSYKGCSKLLLKPRTTEQVSAILKHCFNRRLAVCPQGGNTGLVGGSVPVFDEIILSTALMNKIVDFNQFLGVVICEAGCILENLNTYVSNYSRIMPIELGAKGSCHIGGNIATNAGGIHFVRYGSLRENTLGLEVVLPNGDIFDGLNMMKKDNTGYDIKQLFIGSEGTLGFITKVAIVCPPQPNSTAVALLGCSSFEKVLQIYLQAQNKLNEVLSSLEYMDHNCIALVKSHLKLLPIISENFFYMVIEVAGSNPDHDEEKLYKFMDDLMSKGLITDGIIATEPSRIEKIWQLRERITEALKEDGYVYKYDISLPQNEFHNIVSLMQTRLHGLIRSCVGYGHLGDSNLHLNFTSTNYNREIVAKIEPFLFQQVQKFEGSISAEHGIGLAKRNYLNFSKSFKSIEIMKRVKNIFDPYGIMNPYKVFV